MEDKNQQNTDVSCDPKLTREQFLRKALKPALIAGAVLSAPRIIDKFLVPAAAAASYTKVTGPYGTPNYFR